VAAAGGGGKACGQHDCTDATHKHDHHHHQQQHLHHEASACSSHDSSIHTIALRCEVPVVMKKFTAWVEELLWEGRGGHHQQQPSTAVAGTVAEEAAAAAAAAAAADQIDGCAEVLRLKGLVDVAGSGRAHMLQVGRGFEARLGLGT
jgi:hypothetical protein